MAKAAVNYTRIGEAIFKETEKIVLTLQACVDTVECRAVHSDLRSSGDATHKGLRRYTGSKCTTREDVPLCFTNTELGRGYNIGIRLIEEFLAKSNLPRCSDFKECGEVIAKVGFKMFLGVTAQLSNVDLKKNEFSLVLDDNPLVDYVELPEQYSALNYSNILCGVIRGALEMVCISLVHVLTLSTAANACGVQVPAGCAARGRYHRDPCGVEGNHPRGDTSGGRLTAFAPVFMYKYLTGK